jgi:PIN domain nuclease of toxin-antitoxin system
MRSYVTDTHFLIWHLQDNPRLSHRGRSIFLQADEGKAIVAIPTIVLVEMVYLADKKRIANPLVEKALDLHRVGGNYQVIPLNLAVVEALERIPRSVVPDMPDRIIAATALLLGIISIVRGKKPGFSEKPGFSPFKPQVIERIRC